MDCSFENILSVLQDIQKRLMGKATVLVSAYHFEDSDLMTFTIFDGDDEPHSVTFYEYEDKEHRSLSLDKARQLVKDCGYE